MKRYFFDLDETLIDTSNLKPLRKTGEGRRFVAEHPERAASKIYDSSIVNMVNRMHKNYKNVAVITNSPLDYSNALLKKHGFADIPVYACMNKPDPFLLQINAQVDSDALIIGDTPIDILAGHGCGVASAGVVWGDSSFIRLNKAEPAAIALKTNLLEEIVNNFESGKIKYRERADPENYVYLKSPSNKEVEIKHIYLEDYYPVTKYARKDNPNYKFSSNVLRFKEIKEHSIDEIKNNARTLFFHKGEIKSGEIFRDVINGFYEKIVNKIYSEGLKGRTAMIAAPNSFPEYCYKSDVNQMMANAVNKEFLKNEVEGRILFRVFPKEEAHSGGGRYGSYDTIGIKKGTLLPRLDNIIIFDDISTTGSQMNSLGYIVRELAGFSGNLYCLTLGKTIKPEDD